MPGRAHYNIRPFPPNLASDEIAWPLLAPDGTNVAPSYSFSDRPGSGMYRNGDKIYLANWDDGVATAYSQLALDNDNVFFAATDRAVAGKTSGLYIHGTNSTVVQQISTSAGNYTNTTLDTNGFTLTGVGTGVADIYTNGLLVASAAKTGAYTVAAGDSVIEADATSAAFTVTLPAAASHDGRVIYVKKTDSSANAVTVDGNGSELVEGSLTQDLLAQGECLTLVCNGTGWSVV